MMWPSYALLLLLTHFGLVQECWATDFAIHDASWQPEYVLFATDEDIIINCQQRHSVVFNGTSPGPPLYLREGQTTWIRVYNHMDNLNLTVHWHGLTMRTAPFSDGSPIVSQWPIGPGDYFDYEIHPEIGDAGTYFYHSHIGFQASTAHGILYVEDAAAPPYQYDDDIPIMLGDFYAKTDGIIEVGLLGIPWDNGGEPDAVVFGDRTGTASFDDAVDDSCKPYVITVQPGKTYRLRFVSATAISFLSIGIESHSNLTVIAADGYYTKPAITDHIQIGGGQRFDALITAKSAEEISSCGQDQFWIRYETRGRDTQKAGYALLQYDTESTQIASTSSAVVKRQRNSPGGSGVGSIGGGKPLRSPGKNPGRSPVTLPPDGTEVTGWLEYTLEALTPQGDFPSLDEVTRTIYITVNTEIINGSYVDGKVTGGMIWVQNALSWTELEAEALHYTPYLIQAYTTGMTPDYDAATSNNGWDPNTKAFPAKVGEVLDIVWQSNSGPTGGFEYHPMHAHGEHYFDLGAGNGTYDPVANEAHFDNYTPARRDTTMLNRYSSKGKDHTNAGWRAWRIRVTDDNVGAWMMHCHILQHMVMGMQTVWVFGDAASILREIPEPYVAGYLEYGGSAYGNDSYDPLVLSYFDDTSI
ncbi:multicopper oxidase [Xylariaceae sp. FL0016]|nr:multicopper oxidase [Xylariaceae sp. FL0016]